MQNRFLELENSIKEWADVEISGSVSIIDVNRPFDGLKTRCNILIESDSFDVGEEFYYYLKQKHEGQING